MKKIVLSLFVLLMVLSCSKNKSIDHDQAQDMMHGYWRVESDNSREPRKYYYFDSNKKEYKVAEVFSELEFEKPHRYSLETTVEGENTRAADFVTLYYGEGETDYEFYEVEKKADGSLELFPPLFWSSQPNLYFTRINR